MGRKHSPCNNAACNVYRSVPQKRYNPFLDLFYPAGYLLRRAVACALCLHFSACMAMCIACARKPRQSKKTSVLHLDMHVFRHSFRYSVCTLARACFYEEYISHKNACMDSFGLSCRYSSCVRKLCGIVFNTSACKAYQKNE